MARASGVRSRLLLVTLSLTTFVGVAGLVVWRRSVGVASAREMRRMDAERRALRSELITLNNDLRRAISRRAVVQEAGDRLGMHVASEAEQRILVDGARTP